MFKKFIIGFIIIFFCLSKISFAQNEVSIEAAYSLINALSVKLNNLNKKINGINSKLVKSNSENAGKLKQIKKTVDSLETELKIQEANLESLNVNINGIEKQLNEDSLQISFLSDSLSTHSKKFSKINKSLDDLVYNVAVLENKIRKIPDIFFCPDCYPVFGVSFELMKLFGKDPNIFQKYLSVAGGFNININNDFRFWFDVSAPLEFVDSKQNDTYYSLFGSAGFMYNFSTVASFNIKGGIGGFYGEIDKRINVDNFNKIMNPLGLTGKVEFSYNQFSFKNPLEIYFVFSGYYSFKTLPDDIGNLLLSASLGFRFNFW